MLAQNLDGVERMERLIALARRSSILRELEQHRAMLPCTLPLTAQKRQDGEYEP